MRDHEPNLQCNVKTGTAKMMTPKTQSPDDKIRIRIQQMAVDIQTLKQNRNCPTHNSGGNWRGRGQGPSHHNTFGRHDQQYNTQSSNRSGKTTFI
jgi:hypothetical protein